MKSSRTKVAALSYSLKVIKSRKKSEFVIHNFSAQKFTTVLSAKERISNFLVGDVTGFGYIIPGHGLKGKKQVIDVDSDLKTMYAIYSGKRELTLWCTGELNEMAKSMCARKDENKENAPTVLSKSKTGKIMQEVNDIMSKLQEKHGTKYSVEKLSAWAHMINAKTHGSYDAAPKYPYFNTETPISQSPVSTPKAQSSAAAATLSRVQCRSECMDQLSKWHSLLEKGVITQQQYNGLQSSIIDDISQL